MERMKKHFLHLFCKFGRFYVMEDFLYRLRIGAIL